MSANPNLEWLRIATPIAASTTRRELFIGTGGEGYTGFHQRLSHRDAVPTQSPGSRAAERTGLYDSQLLSCPLEWSIWASGIAHRTVQQSAALLPWAYRCTALDNKDQPNNVSNIFFRPFSCFIAFANTNQHECHRIIAIFYSMLLFLSD